MSPYPVYPAGVGAWTFTPPLPYEAHVAGAPTLTVELDVDGINPATVVGLLYDVAPDRRATLITRGAHLVPNDGVYVFTFEPQDWRLEAEHRIGLLLSGTDDTWYGSTNSGQTVHVRAGSVSLPFLRNRRDVFLNGKPSPLIAQRGTFEVSAQIIADNTIVGPLPPEQRKSSCWLPKANGGGGGC